MTSTLPHGTALRGGDYVIDSVLGSGGFGITYLAAETLLQRHVAIKEFFPSGCRREGLHLAPGGDWTQEYVAKFRNGFLREGRHLARLRHQGVVPVYGIFEEFGTAYLVMEYVEGETLRDYMAARHGRLRAEEAVTVIGQAGEALAEVHARGLLHRDLKPANLMLRPDGQVVIIDFGAAREMSGDLRRFTALLTPGYAPYEQYDEFGVFGPATDIYALAAVLYHLLTGRIPVNAVSRRNGVPLPDPRTLAPEISPELSHAVMRGLEMDPLLRPSNVLAFLNLLPGAEGRRAIAVTASGSLAAAAPSREPAAAVPGPPSSSPSTHPLPSRRVMPRCVRSMKGHQRPVYSVAWSPDGARLLSAGADGSLRIWNPGNGDLQCVMQGPATAVNSAVWSGDGVRICSGGWHPDLLVWNAMTGVIEQTLTGHTKSISSLAWSAAAGHIASAGADRTARIWDPTTGQAVAELRGHTDRVTSVCWSPDGRMLATGSDDRTVRLWSGEDHAEAALLGGPMNAVASVGWSRDGSRLAASGYASGTVWIWNVALRRLDRTIEVDAAAIMLAAYSVAWRPDGSVVAFGCQDGTVQIWSPEGSAPAHVVGDLGKPIYALAWSPDGSQLATGSGDQMVRVWEIP